MQAGRVFRRFSAKNGQEVVLRTPRLEDLDELLKLINSLVEEKTEIAITEKVTREQETEWLQKTLMRLERDELFFLVAEVEGRVVASSDLHIQSGDESHVGVLGIVIRNGFRDFGIGTQMMKTLVEQAAALGLKLLTLEVFATNRRAIHVYEKLGFEHSGRIPKRRFRDGQYIDELIMTKLID